MSIQHLDPEGRPDPTAGTLRVVPAAETNSWPAALTQIEATLDAAGDLGQEMTTAGYAEVLWRLDRVQRRLEGMRLEVISAALQRGVARDRGYTDTGAWVAATTTGAHRTGRADVKLAESLHRRLPGTLAALGAGDLSREHAAVIEHLTRTLPRGLSTEQLECIEADLIEQAASTDPLTLRRRARRALKVIEPDENVVDAHEDEVLRSEEERAYDRAKLSLRDNGDGTATGHFTIPTLAADILSRVLDAMASPRRANFGATHAQSRDTRTVETDSFERRFGQAFTELIEHLPTDHLSGKTAANIVITVSFEALQDKLKAAGVDTGQAISASAARRLACQAGLLPAVLGKQSQVLDLGRSSRLFREPQRIALGTRHTTCSAHGCQRPYAWTELHHRTLWSHGGTTNLKDAIPLCGFHHRRIHDPHYDHQETRCHMNLPVITFHRRT
jgi:Domain of unknown function (DUF222)